MSNPNTATTTAPSVGHRNTVIDTFRNITHIIDSDVLPGSLQKSVADSENSQGSTVNQQTTVTQFRLDPSSGDVNYLPKNHITQSITHSVTIKADKAPNARIKLKVFYWAPNTLPDKWTLYVNGTTCGTTNHQRWEAMATNASLSSEVIESDPNYTTLDKLINDRPCMSVTLYFPKGETSHTFTFTIDASSDLSHLTPLISNIVFWHRNYGSAYLEVDYERLDKALLIVPIPETYTEDGTLYIPNFHVIEPQPFGKPFKVTTNTAQPLATGDNTIKASIPGEKVQLTATLDNWTTATNKGMSLTQYNARLTGESNERINAFMASDNMVNIPSQHWVSQYATTSEKAEGTNDTAFAMAAGNINMVAFGFPYLTTSSVYLPNPRFKAVNVEIAGSTGMAPRTYQSIDARLIKDMSQALINDDVWGLNSNVLDSLKLLPDTGKIYDRDTYAAVYSDTSGPLVKRPNHTVFAFEVSPLSDFMRGANVGLNSQVNIMFNYTTTENIDQGIDQLNPGPIVGTRASPIVSCLQDVVLSLKYSPEMKKCNGAELKYAQPRRA